MPTHRELPQFLRDWQRLSPEQRTAFLRALPVFVTGLAVQSFAQRLRVKRVQGNPDVWELTWATDGRATFSYGPEAVTGEPHIVWRRIGTHAIFRRP